MIRNITLLIFFLSSSLSASSLTLLVDTRDNISRGEMEMDQLTQVVSLETGVMDTLFDNGHIFFNIYTVSDNRNSQKEDESALKYALEQGAEYLLVLEPDSQGSYWKLYNAVDASMSATGYIDISVTDPEKKDAERWVSLGEMLAAELIKQLG